MLLWCLAVLIVLDVTTTIIASYRLKAGLAKVKAESAPLTFAEATPPRIPADQNAATAYLRVAEMIKPHTYIGKRELSPTGTGYVREAGQPLGYGGGDWFSAQDLKGLAGLLKQDADALELLNRAAALPGCRFDDDWSEIIPTSMLHLSKLRDVARFCADATAVAAAQGDAALTARRLRAGLALSVHTTRAPTFISQTVAYACFSVSQRSAEFALPRCTISASDPRAILALLTGIDLRANLEEAMQTERARTLSIYGMAHRKPWSVSGDDSEAGMGWAIWTYARALPPLFRHDETAYLEYMERTIQATAAQWNDFPRLNQELNDWSRGGLKCTVVARIFSADLSEAAVARLCCQTRLNLISASLGLSVYKQRTGQYPESLSDLARINWPVPQDPFSTGPLRYQRIGDRYVLYSVGPDGIDDGGKPTWEWRADRSGPKPKDEDPSKGDLPWQWR